MMSIKNTLIINSILCLLFINNVHAFNLLLNGNFESGTNNWTNYPSSTGEFGIETNNVYEGNKAIYVCKQPDKSGYCYAKQTVNVEPLKNYKLSGYIYKNDSSVDYAKLRIIFLDSNGDKIKKSGTTDTWNIDTYILENNLNEWRYLSVIETTPTNAVQAIIYCYTSVREYPYRPALFDNIIFEECIIPVNVDSLDDSIKLEVINKIVPENGTSKIRCFLPLENMKYILNIYNINGHLVRALANYSGSGWVFQNYNGWIEFDWNGLDDNGKRLPIGLYIIILEASQAEYGITVKRKESITIGKRLK